MNRPTCNIIWFKRDIRLSDHGPLAQAIKDNLPIILVYFFEPSILRLKETDDRHTRFIYQSLQFLRKQLARYQLPLYMFQEEGLTVLDKWRHQFDIHGIYSHQETGLNATFDRDKEIKQWCLRQGITYREFVQDGVVRGRRHRKEWKEQLSHFLTSPQHSVDLSLLTSIQLTEKDIGIWQAPTFSNHIMTSNPQMQPGGSHYAWKYLTSFMDIRAKSYGYQLSKPEASRYSCSRLSPYLAFGNISVREVYQYMSSQLPRLAHGEMLSAFEDRLWWRSHYIQKLEAEQELEERAMNPGLRDMGKVFNASFYQAWIEGTTGFPMVDACMRCLQATGYLNFRMRAMLATFWSFSLWQPWKPGAVHLARVFLDFEPGIHYAQWQMQAGLTGYHPLRIFNPIRQFTLHDPEAIFVKKWVPELAHLPTPQIYEPYKMTLLEQKLYACIIGTDYPKPIVDYDTATKKAKDEYWKFRTAPETKRHLAEIWLRHCLPENAKEYKAMNVN